MLIHLLARMDLSLLRHCNGDKVMPPAAADTPPTDRVHLRCVISGFDPRPREVGDHAALSHNGTRKVSIHAPAKGATRDAIPCGHRP